MLVVFDNLIIIFLSLLIIESHCVSSCCSYIHVGYIGVIIMLYQRFTMLI